VGSRGYAAPKEDWGREARRGFHGPGGHRKKPATGRGDEKWETGRRRSGEGKVVAKRAVKKDGKVLYVREEGESCRQHHQKETEKSVRQVRFDRRKRMIQPPRGRFTTSRSGRAANRGGDHPRANKGDRQKGRGYPRTEFSRATVTKLHGDRGGINLR